MTIGWIMGGFFIVVTIIFVVIAFYFPEWVGITGAKAKQTLEEHKEENPKTDA